MQRYNIAYLEIIIRPIKYYNYLQRLLLIYIVRQLNIMVVFNAEIIR